MTKKTSRREKGITLIALIVTIIVLLILAGVTINLAVNNQGIFNKAKTATMSYKNASENEQTVLNEVAKEIAKYKPKEGTEGGSGSETGSVNITYTDSAGKIQPLTKSTPAGTKIGTTANIDGQTLDWYLFDVSDDGKNAYLVSTPTYWVPDTTKEVSGAWVPKLGGTNNKAAAMRQAIQKKVPTWDESKDCGYASNSVTYTPSANTLSYYKSVNSQWSANRGSVDFKSLNENEQAACYLADADIFAGIKDQVNKADGNLKGKIQTLVGGASLEQWCKAYNKQTKVKEQQPNGGITCEYSTKNAPGYIYKVNGTAQNSGWTTDINVIFGNDIYGAANNNGKTTNNPFNSLWWLASPSSQDRAFVCDVRGNNSDLAGFYSQVPFNSLSLLASVSL